MDINIRQIQLECLKILDIVHDICNSNNIQYSLCGGSVVGAHLYKGCLPWDDDIDIMMTRENYNHFISIAPSLLPKGFVMKNYQTGNYLLKGITKIINENTTYIEENGAISGIFLDITCYDKVPTNFLRYIDMFLVRRLWTAERGRVEGKGIKMRIRNLFYDIFLRDRRRFYMFCQKVVELLSSASHYNYSEIFGAWAQDIPFRPSIFENYSDIEFEDKRYMVVRDYIEYLQTRYNRTDFREPKEKQVPPHIVYVNFDLPYKEYIKKHQ